MANELPPAGKLPENPPENREITTTPDTPETARVLGSIWQKVERAKLKTELLKERHLQLHGPKIPKLTPRSAPRYIAAVAQAVKEKQLDAKQANAMLYAAQLLIAASRLDQPPKPRRKPKASGPPVIEG